MVCQKCGKPIENASAFCRHCGAKIERFANNSQNPGGTQKPTPQAERYCPHCGAPDNADGAFCTACGRRLKTEPIKSGKKRTRILMISIAATAACFLLIAGVFLLARPGASEAGYEASAAYSAGEVPEAPATEESLQQLKEGQIRIRGDVSAVLAYAEQIVRTSNVTRIYMFDMDGDNISELILRTATSEADALYEFYSYRNASLLPLGSISAGHSSLYIQKGKLILHFGNMGHEKVNELTLQQNSVISTCTLERELAGEEEYLHFFKEPYYSEAPDMSVLSNTYVVSEERIADTTDYYVRQGDCFTDGRIYYQVLRDGQLLRVDAASGEVCTPFGYVMDYTALFAVTQERLYFIYDEPEEWWGIQVFSYTIEGDDFQDLGGGWEAEFRDGMILLEGFRSDVSPKSVTVIDAHDRMLVSMADAWDAEIFNGAVYYLAVDFDAWSSNKPYVMQEYRVDSFGETPIAAFEMTNEFARIDEGTICITQGWEPYTSVTYDLLTGKET